MKLMKFIITGVALILAFQTFGQVAIIQDKDGYTNVRKNPGINSEVIYELKENEVFFYDHANSFVEEKNSDWKYVKIPRNDFSISTSGNRYYQGFVHKSGIRPLTDLKKLNNPEIKLVFNISAVDTANKTMTSINKGKANGGKYLIDGFRPYGLSVPLYLCTQVSSLKLISDGKEFPQPPIITQDLYNISFEEGNYKSTSKRFYQYVKDGLTFIHQECGDGSGYYEIVWVIDQNRIIQRLVGWLY